VSGTVTYGEIELEKGATITGEFKASGEGFAKQLPKAEPILAKVERLNVPQPPNKLTEGVTDTSKVVDKKTAS